MCSIATYLFSILRYNTLKYKGPWTGIWRFKFTQGQFDAAAGPVSHDLLLIYNNNICANSLLISRVWTLKYDLIIHGYPRANLMARLGYPHIIFHYNKCSPETIYIWTLPLSYKGLKQNDIEPDLLRLFKVKNDGACRRSMCDFPLMC